MDATAAVDSFIIAHQGASDKNAKALALENKKKALNDLKAKQAIPHPVASDISDSESREEQLIRETSELAIRESLSGGSSSSTASGSEKREALLKKKAELDERRRSLSAGKISLVPTSGTSARITGISEAVKKLEAELAREPSRDALIAEKERSERRLDEIQRGIDVCFLMDCTGSMESFISAAKDKIPEIVAKVELIEATAIVRIAFVGYRDYGDGALQHEVVDFVRKAEMGKFTTKLASCPATGGGDGPEDIAGGYKLATELSWISSTRLLIHFADCPCHGTKYHSMSDDHPGGDPNGLIPEDLLKQIIKKRIDYYFMKITQNTDKMISIFQKVFEECGNEIRVNPIAANASDFVPKVINSISDSMSRSAAFQGKKTTY